MESRVVIPRTVVYELAGSYMGYKYSYGLVIATRISQRSLEPMPPLPGLHGGIGICMQVHDGAEEAVWRNQYREYAVFLSVYTCVRTYVHAYKHTCTHLHEHIVYSCTWLHHQNACSFVLPATL